MVEIFEFKVPYESGERYTIAALSDFHLGNRSADQPLIRKTVGWAEAWADLVIFGGDAADAVDIKDRRFDWSSIDRALATPEEQYLAFVEIMQPLADKLGENLIIIPGNHDKKVSQIHGGTNYLKQAAETLGASYSDGSAFIRLRFERRSGDNVPHRTKFDIYAHHGATAARTKGGKLNKVKSMDQIFEADVYLMSHVHDLDAVRVPVLTVNEALQIAQRKRYYALTGGFLKGYEKGPANYVEWGMYAPTSLGGVFLNLECEKATSYPVQIGDIPVEVRGV